MSIRAAAGVWLAALIIMASGGSVSFAGDVPEPDGYRLSDFRADVPATLKGARVVSTEKARFLWQLGRALFVDVMPRPPRPPNLPQGTVWRDMRRDGIPGSRWLANVGFGHLDAGAEDYFRTKLRALTKGDLGQAVVFYCLPRCWMSWNAAKRALSFGHTNVIWYPAGTDGWEAAGLPLEKVTPVK